MADEFVGSAVYLKWTFGATGTLILAPDYRNWNYAPSIDLLDATAGADTSRQYVKSYKDGRASLSGVLQPGGTITGNAAGTIYNAFTEGTIGTMEWGPEGTAAGKPKFSAPFMSMGLTYNPVYNQIQEFSVDLQQNGARTDGTY